MRLKTIILRLLQHLLKTCLARRFRAGLFVVPISNRECPDRTQGTCPSLRRYQSGPRKDLAMFRLLSIFALSVLCTLPDRVSADTLKPHESLASEISSRQRCACTWRGIIHHRRYRNVRTAYLIGYDPLPYRFGSTLVWERPYRYYWR